MKATMLITVLLGLLSASPSRALDVTPKGDNAVSGGFGFQAGLSDWAPGGFKWFNDYFRRLNRLVWLNFQINATFGDLDDRHCWYDNGGNKHCDYRRWDGNQVDFVAGVRLAWLMKKIPLLIYAKLGGAVDLLLYGFDYTGIAFAFRGGVGARFFFLPNFGVGAELLSALGPSIIADGPGAQFYASLDFQVIGVEYRW